MKTPPVLSILTMIMMTALTVSCSREGTSTTQDGSIKEIIERLRVPPKSSLSYEEMLKKIDGERKALATQYRKNRDIKEVQEAFFRFLNQDIFPYWYGTPWDFNGTTNEPGKGVVACGYFVSTTMRHIEFKLNRFKLAQKAAADIVDFLCEKSSIKRISSIDALKAHLLSLPNNRMYVVGLDYHVGFISKENDELFFIHSNYIDREGVVRERFDNSPALHASNLYVIGSISENISMLEKWLGV